MSQPVSTKPSSFWSRLPLAFSAFVNTLSDPDYANRLQRMNDAASYPPAPVAAPAPAPAPAPLRVATPDAALQLLSLLQREARLIDFTQENLSAYADADIGAAARVVHEGCGKVLREHFHIEPVREEAEGSRVVLEEGFDASAVRLTGNVVGKAPFRGTLSHRGWRATNVLLPKLAEAHDASVLAPAEVEL